MATISPTTTYTGVPRPGTTQRYVYSYNSGTNSISDVAASVYAGGAKSALCFVFTEGNVTAVTLKFKAHATLGAVVGVTMGPEEVGVIVDGTLTTPAMLLGAVPLYVAPSLSAISSSAGVTSVLMEIRW